MRLKRDHHARDTETLQPGLHYPARLMFDMSLLHTLPSIYHMNYDTYFDQLTRSDASGELKEVITVKSKLPLWSIPRE